MSDHVTVIPVFNEAATIGGLVERAALHGPVIVVDDGSWDGSAETAAAAGGGSLMEPTRLHALRVAGFFINWLTGQHVADTQSGFRVYPRELLERVSPR